MNTLQIFLGSSFLLRDQRALIGDEIRKLSTRWECRGVRIRLNCWEDFAPEYIGTSKQEEYNGFLVRPSQIFVALLGNRIGYYTEREIDTAVKAISRDNVHCICMPEKATPEEYYEVNNLLSEKGITPLNVYNDKQLIERLTQLIERYIEINYPKDCNQSDFISSCGNAGVYATIAEDVHNAGVVTREQFGNMIRSLDDRLEEDFGKRCYLYPYGDTNNISQADYYLSLLKDSYSDSEKKEVFQAFKERPQQHKPICTFIKQGGRITSNHTELQELLKTTEAFSCEFETLDTIKLTLFFHLYKTQSTYINEAEKEFKLKDGRIYFLGNYLADVSGLKNSETLNMLEKELASIDAQLRVPGGRRFDLWNRRTSLEAQITQKMLLALNDFLLQESRPSHYDASEDIDYDLAEQACRDEDDACSAYIEYNVQQKLERINRIVNHVEYIRQFDNSLAEIGKALCALYVNAESLARMPLPSPMEFLQTLFYMVSLSDTYSSYRQVSFDEDNLYGLVVSVADKYEVLSPKVEMMRINYANSYGRKLQHSAANKYYLQAVENMDKFDDSTQYIRYLICRAYTFAIEHLMEVNIHTENVYRLLEAYRMKITTWSEAGTPYYIGEGMYWASKLKCLSSGDNLEELINKAELAYENVQRYSPLSPEHHSYDDVYCYLPNNIAAFYIDNFPFSELQQGRSAFEKVIKYSEIECDNAKRLADVDEFHAKVYIAKAKHQLGFLYATQQNLFLWSKVLPLYIEAYKIRKDIFAMTQNPSDEAEIAETATNVGGFIYQVIDNLKIVQRTPLWNEVKDFVLTNKYSFADEAVDIYSRHITWGEEEKEKNYYKALQLKGSLLYVCAEQSFPDGDKKEGIRLMRQAYEWNKQHPLNGYKDTFENISGEYLKRE